jgi:hypothetical protein
MTKFQTICSSLLLLILSPIAASAQNPTAKTGDSPGATITASATGERVRFAASSSVVQIRLEVYNSTGRKLFDNEVRGGNVLDWHLQDGQAEPLADDSYLCVLTVKSLSGKLTQRIGSVTVDKATANVQPADVSQMTPQQSQAIGPMEENASLTVLKEDDNQTTTVIAHNGEDGQITRGRGALSFRIGDFFSGKDIEQMRLTPEGNLGIGITHPLVRLDVDGLVRASQGIVFPDGSIQYSAATRTFGAKSSLPDPTFQSLQSKSGKKSSGGKEHIDAAGTGTLNFIAKWQETGGAGTLQNSSIFDDGFMLSIGPGMNQPAPGAALVFDLQRPSASDVLQRFWNTGTGGAKLRYVASVGATSQIQLTDLNEWLSSIAGNNSIGLQFRVRDVGDANDEATLAARPRMSILRNGNVGIGIPSPISKLHIVSGSGDGPPRLQSTGTTGFAAGWDIYHGATPKGYVGVPDAGGGLGPGEMLLYGSPGVKTSLWAGGNRSVTIDTNGNVSLGVGSVSLGGPKLTVQCGDQIGVSAISNTLGVLGSTVTGTGVLGHSDSGSGVVGETSYGTIIGIGVAGNSVSGTGMRGMSTNGIGVNGTSTYNAGVSGYSENDTGLVARSTNGFLVAGFPSLAGGVRTFHIDLNGTYVAGSDFAESLPVRGDKASYEPGDVLVVTTRASGGLEKSRRPYDVRVAGVYSTRPGMLGADKDGATRIDPGEVPVAIIGIVPTKVSTENGPVRIGDLLTTSHTSGYAMRCNSRVRCIGAIVGKSIEPLSKRKGVIKVLVTLR